MNSVSMPSIIALIFLEIILSIDNLIFISTLMTSVDKRYREIVKIIGISLALIMRLSLLFVVNHLMAIDKTFFYIGSMEITYKEFLFIIGGFFLIYKASGEARKIVMNEHEIHNTPKKLIANENSALKVFINSILQIIVVDLIFSIDSVIVAIALVNDMKIIIIATLVSMATLLVSTTFLSKILTKYPSLKLLAMAFIIAIGIVFVLDGFEVHVERSYIHVALVFALIFEIFDIIRLKNLDEKNNQINK
jgi:predicted tellurium resistance membrane protein TerC